MLAQTNARKVNMILNNQAIVPIGFVTAYKNKFAVEQLAAKAKNSGHFY
jgi:hypothetical protein